MKLTLWKMCREFQSQSGHLAHSLPAQLLLQTATATGLSHGLEHVATQHESRQIQAFGSTNCLLLETESCQCMITLTRWWWQSSQPDSTTTASKMCPEAQKVALYFLHSRTSHTKQAAEIGKKAEGSPAVWKHSLHKMAAWWKGKKKRYFWRVTEMSPFQVQEIKKDVLFSICSFYYT